MARGKKAPVEPIFLGTSRELYYYLCQKRAMLLQLLKDKRNDYTSEQRKKIKHYYDLIEDMLVQKYFTDGDVFSMREMIEMIKLERADLLCRLNELEIDVGIAKKLADAALAETHGYMAQQYEQEYDSYRQRALREAVDEYQALKHEYDAIVSDRKALHCLLGVINRPNGFFKNVLYTKGT